jgi:hypothetical protein
MTAPSIDVMNALSITPVWNTPTLIHCYAGFGRTGTALLFFWFRWKLLNKMFPVYDTVRLVKKGFEALTEPFLGCKTIKLAGFTESGQMFDRLKDQFKDCISIEKLDNKYKRGNTFRTQNLVEELFDIHSLTSANRFVARINNILLYTALYLNVETDRKYSGLPPSSRKIREICFYTLHNNCPPGENSFNKHTIFQNPTMTDINMFVEKNIFGLKSHNIEYTGAPAAGPPKAAAGPPKAAAGPPKAGPALASLSSTGRFFGSKLSSTPKARDRGTPMLATLGSSLSTP